MLNFSWKPPKLYPSPIRDDKIRLVALHRAENWQDDISCNLYPMKLLDKYERPPEYTALSYAWGTTLAEQPIIVNGDPVEVTVNLESALRHIRKPDKDIILWIDALSINQADVTERTFQVARMRDIYSTAAEVIIFLGNARHHRISGNSRDYYPGRQVAFNHTSSDDVLVSRFLERWGPPSIVRSVRALDIFSLLRVLASWQRDSPGEFEPISGISDARLRTLFEALRMMMRSPWWDRMWVIQEIIVANKVTFQYGNVSAPWSIFTAAALAHTQLSSLSDEYMTVLRFFSRRVADIENRRQIWRTNSTTSLLALLREFSARRASDDRDKIYALLGLCSDSTAVFPDYSLDVKSAYTWATIDSINTTGTLSVLNGDLGRKNRQDLPSWTPDWSAAFDENDRRRADLFDDKYNACNGLAAVVHSVKFGAPSAGPHIIQQMRDLIDSLKAHRLGPGHLISQVYQEVFQSYGRQHPGAGHLCEELATLCHPSGRAARKLVDMGSMIEEDGKLRSWANLIGRVARVGQPLFSTSDMSATCATISAWAQILENSHEVQKRDAFARGFAAIPVAKLEFATTLVADTKATASRLERLTEADHSALVDWYYRRILDVPPIQIPEAEHADPEMLDSFTRALRMAATRRVFFVTDQGQKMGLGPASMKSGDQVYVLPGGKMPVILRHRKDSEYTLVGECYLQGAMDGSQSGGMKIQVGCLPEDMFPFVTQIWEMKADTVVAEVQDPGSNLKNIPKTPVKRSETGPEGSPPWEDFQHEILTLLWPKMEEKKRERLRLLFDQMETLSAEIDNIETFFGSRDVTIV